MNIHNAVKAGNRSRVSELLHSGVAVNNRNQHGWTALMRAAHKGDVRMIHFLLKKGANAKLKEPHFRQTPLIMATAFGHVNAIRALLQKSNLNAKTIDGMSALSFVTANGRDPAVARMLLRAGAKLDSNAREYMINNNKWRNVVTEMFVRRGAAKRGVHNMYTAMRMRTAKARAPANILAQKVYHPSRVTRMTQRYGNNWMNKV